jgi:hypothetical protein
LALFTPPKLKELAVFMTGEGFLSAISRFAVIVDADSIWLNALALLGLLTGVFLFFSGFRMLRYKRLILNTPFSKIRSASMGLVEVSGMPTGPKTIFSAITGAQCYYYRARAWQWLASGKGGSWQPAVDESVCVPFFLEDSTAKVLVNPRGATLDVHRSFYDEIRTSFLDQDSPVPESIRKFVATRGLAAGDKVRLEEHIIKPGYPLFVFGTLGENATLNSWSAQLHVGAKKISLSFSLGGSSALKFTRTTTVSGIAANALAGMLERASRANTQTCTFTSRSDGGPFEVPEDVRKTLKQAGVDLLFPVLVDSGKMTASNTTSDGGAKVANPMRVAIASGQAPLSEVAQARPEVQPQESTGAFDLHSRVAISQGQRGDPFTISSQSQREVVQALGWKSMACIWGGPVFALICVYFLFVYWGWM